MDLEKNTDFFKSILENASEGILIVNTKGVIEITNLRIEELFGYSWNELVGQSIEILLPESLRKLHTKYRSEYNANPHSRPMGQGIDLIALRKDGSEFPVEIGLAPIDTEDGQMVLAPHL